MTTTGLGALRIIQGRKNDRAPDQTIHQYLDFLCAVTHINDPIFSVIFQ
jgi:hypothetical protein